MAIKSVYTPQPDWAESGVMRITGDEMRHLMVGRVATGEAIEAFDGAGAVWTAAIESINRKEILARVTATRTAEPDPCALILGMALVRTAAFEWALEKAVEVGVTRIAPFSAARSNAAAPRTMDRWTRIVVEAAKQSKRFRLPTLDAPSRFEDVLEIPASTRVVFAERDGAALGPAVVGSPALFLIGPEGGWTDTELESAREKGFALVSLGTGILKAETAAIVGAALLRYELGR